MAKKAEPFVTGSSRSVKNPPQPDDKCFGEHRTGDTEVVGWKVSHDYPSEPGQVTHSSGGMKIIISSPSWSPPKLKKEVSPPTVVRMVEQPRSPMAVAA